MFGRTTAVRRRSREKHWFHNNSPRAYDAKHTDYSTGISQSLLQLQAWVSANSVLKDSMIKCILDTKYWWNIISKEKNKLIGLHFVGWPEAIEGLGLLRARTHVQRVYDVAVDSVDWTIN